MENQNDHDDFSFIEHLFWETMLLVTLYLNDCYVLTDSLLLSSVNAKRSEVKDRKKDLF